MADLIDRQKALDSLCELTDFLTSFDQDFYDLAVDGLKDLPAVDAVPVVRCQDCVYSLSLTDPITAETRLFCDLHWRDRTAADGFCSRGERKGGKNDG